MRRAMTIVGCVLAIGCSAFAQPHVLGTAGEVRIVQGSNARRVIVMVDTQSSSKDGLVDQWFIFESAEALPVPNGHYSIAQIVYREGNLRLISHADRSIVDFVVDGHPFDTPVPHGYAAARFDGIGLSRSTGETRVPIVRGNRGTLGTNCEGVDCDESLDYTGEGGGGGSSCDAGGEGSTQCSASSGTYSCSVTCAGGYYACCNVVVGGVSCKCRRNAH